jgi:hypothetical protein
VGKNPPTTSHDCPAGQVEQAEQEPALQVSQGGQSLSDWHAGPHCPLLLPGNRLHTAGRAHSLPELEHEPGGAVEPVSEASADPSGRTEPLLDPLLASPVPPPEELPLLLLDPAPESSPAPPEELPPLLLDSPLASLDPPDELPLLPPDALPLLPESDPPRLASPELASIGPASRDRPPHAKSRVASTNPHPPSPPFLRMLRPYHG